MQQVGTLDVVVTGALVAGSRSRDPHQRKENVAANLHPVWSGRVKHEGVEGAGHRCLEYHKGGESAPLSPRIPTAESVFATENREKAPTVRFANDQYSSALAWSGQLLNSHC